MLELKNEKIAIVTNSNKAAAKKVLEITGLEKYINIWKKNSC